MSASATGTVRAGGKVVAIVQARLGSSRLPLKSLLSLRGMPIIDWVTRRLSRARRLDGILVAVPDTELDRVLLEHLERRGVPVSDLCRACSQDTPRRMSLALRLSPIRTSRFYSPRFQP